ncbi:MAG TPA: NADPH:quinone reductase [Xanthobacteraceae bacterium]|jgi:NADPH2:quinone reductase|nr:NADPH:quinone reductase [Xanthobacteraceae bacterium]
MRAAWYEKNGAAADVLHVGEVETPRPGPGEVRVRLVTSGVNPSDVKSRAGTARKIAFPRVIPHSDGAGEIDQVGEGVPPARIGDRVWTWNGQWKRAFGTAAEYVTLPAAQAVALPANTGFAAGACLGIPALTAWHALALADAKPGMTLLIAGGAGAVAHYAIQFAKARGAGVITTVSSGAKAEVARAAGADHTLDYKRENVGERVAAIAGKAGVDAIIELDLAANASLIPAVLRPKGTVVVYGTGKPEAAIPAGFCLVNSIRLQFMLVYELTADERARAIADIGRLLAANALIHNVAKTLPLADIVAAHQLVESGTAVGNVVMEMG